MRGLPRAAQGWSWAGFSPELPYSFAFRPLPTGDAGSQDAVPRCSQSLLEAKVLLWSFQKQ